LGHWVAWLGLRGGLLGHIEVENWTRNIFCIEFATSCFQYSMPLIDVLLSLLVEFGIIDIGVLSDEQINVINKCFECKLNGFGQDR